MRAAVALGCCLAIAAVAHGESAQPLGSSCEASAARTVACPKGQPGDTCLLVGDNEVPGQLFLYTLKSDGGVANETALPLVDADGSAVEVGDIEAVEVADGRVWVVGSHSRKSWSKKEGAGSKKQCARSEKRLAIFDAAWPPESLSALAGRRIATRKKDWEKLLRADCASELFDLDPKDANGRKLAAAACAEFRRTDEQANEQRDACAAAFNIEGAAAIPGKDGKRRLWLGLRGPTLGGRALLLRLAPGDRFRFDGVASADLGKGRGVRDLNYGAGRLWFLAGPVSDTTGVKFVLEVADLASLESGARLEPRKIAKVREQSEGLALSKDGTRAWIVTDGVKGEPGANACKLGSTLFGVRVE